MTHTIEIKVSAEYQHSKEKEESSVKITGNGDIDHMLDAFKASLVAAGFSIDFAKNLTIKEE